MPLTQVVSARAECYNDVQNLIEAIWGDLDLIPSRPLSVLIKEQLLEGGHLVPDVAMELRFKNPVEFEVIDRMASEIMDGHVLHQSLRPVSLENNSLERDHNK